MSMFVATELGATKNVVGITGLGGALKGSLTVCVAPLCFLKEYDPCS